MVNYSGVKGYVVFWFAFFNPKVCLTCYEELQLLNKGLKYNMNQKVNSGLATSHLRPKQP
jgi:hypothetical protein